MKYVIWIKYKDEEGNLQEGYYTSYGILDTSDDLQDAFVFDDTITIYQFEEVEKDFIGDCGDYDSELLDIQQKEIELKIKENVDNER